jgi:hypothetical protein
LLSQDMYNALLWSVPVGLNRPIHQDPLLPYKHLADPHTVVQ